MGFFPVAAFLNVLADAARSREQAAATQPAEPICKDADVLDVRHGDNEGALPPPAEPAP